MRTNEHGHPIQEPIKQIVVRPTLDREEAEKKFKGRYLSRTDFDLCPTESVWGKFEDGSTAFLYLVDGLPEYHHDFTEEGIRLLKFNDVEKHSRRAGLKGSKGGELVLGHVNFPFPRMAAHNAKQWEAYSGFMVLVQWLSATVHAWLPEYQAQQLAISTAQMG